MNREEIIEEMKLRYLKNEPITEREMVESDMPFFQDIIKVFGSWRKMEDSLGLKQRHINERERYFLFMTMKLRQERFGIDALRHKNIEEELKDKIKAQFRTVKKLIKEVINGWNQDRVVYEAHTYFLTGGTPESLQKKNPELYQKALLFFLSEEKFYNEYTKRLLINPIEEVEKAQETEKVVEEELQNNSAQGFGLKDLVEIGYMSKQEAQEIQMAAVLPKEDVLKYLETLGPEIDSASLAQENRVMFLAIRNKFGTLEEARQELQKQKCKAKQA
ncbi:hypothetical protein SFC65_20225 [Priestia filamentosa]|uniref:hypothetical protein n=1 Tax=Priestia filamentosa TaxID=1402861 RepID=UPI003982A74F